MGSAYEIYDQIAEIMQARKQPWRQQAACRGMGPEIFYPGRGGRDSAATARAACERCPVRAECAAEALTAFTSWDDRGYWAGTSPAQRRAMRGEQPRPPKPVTKTEKWCPRCERTRPADRFYVSPTRTDGLSPWCSDCHRRNRVEQRAQQRAAS